MSVGRVHVGRVLPLGRLGHHDVEGVLVDEVALAPAAEWGCDVVGHPGDGGAAGGVSGGRGTLS